MIGRDYPTSDDRESRDSESRADRARRNNTFRQFVADHESKNQQTARSQYLALIAFVACALRVAGIRPTSEQQVFEVGVLAKSAQVARALQPSERAELRRVANKMWYAYSLAQGGQSASTAADPSSAEV